MVTEDQSAAIDFLAAALLRQAAAVVRGGFSVIADADVLRRQLADGVGTVHWQRLDACAPPEAVLANAASAVAAFAPMAVPTPLRPVRRG
jgi:hypothetical protein